LLKGVGGDDQWRQLGNAARFGKVFASNNNCLVVMCAQLSEEGAIRYSKAIKDHSDNMWSWVYNKEAQESHVIWIHQQKSRNQKAHSFGLVESFETMTIRDLSDDERQNINLSQQEEKPKAKNSSRPTEIASGADDYLNTM
jgi:hypothetical protein